MTIQDPEVHPDQIPLIPIKKQEKLEALKPDRELIHSFGKWLMTELPYPDVKTDEAIEIMDKACTEIRNIAKHLQSV